MNRMTRRSVLATGAALAVSGDPAEAASSERRLVGMLGQRCRMLAQTSGFSGAVVLIHDQRELYAESFGHRNRSEGLANRIDTRFNIASIGKLFTSLSIMRLVEAGRLRLDAPLIEAWPSYLDKVVAQRITVGQILTHTAGLGNAVMFKSRGYALSAQSQSDLVRLFAKDGLASEPGAVAYSNDGYVLLGALIERLSGKNFKVQCRETIFAPLGMDDTGFGGPDDIVPNFALPYVRDLARPGVWRSAIASDGLASGAFGGGYATVRDLAAFGSAMRDGRLLSSDLHRSWVAERVPLRSGRYGYGVQVETINGKRFFGHTGGHSGVAGELLISESTGHVFAVLSNGEVEPYWDLAAFIRTALAGESDSSRNHAFTTRLCEVIARDGVEAGIAMADANPDRKPREGLIETFGFRAWHAGDPGAAERLLLFNRTRFTESLSALWGLAELYRYAGRNDEAVAVYKAFLERQPGDEETIAYIAQLSGQ